MNKTLRKWQEFERLDDRLSDWEAGVSTSHEKWRGWRHFIKMYPTSPSAVLVLYPVLAWLFIKAITGGL